MKNLSKLSVVFFSLSFMMGVALEAQQRGQPAPAQLDLLPIRGNLYMLAGAGGNIALSVGPDGVLIVDTGNLQNVDRVLAAVQQLQKQLATNGLQAWEYAAQTRSNL